MMRGPFSTLTGEGARRLKESGDRIVVAGAGGWLGLATLEALHALLGVSFHQRVAAFGSNARTLRLRGGLDVPQAPLSALRDLPPAPTLVLHLAFLTQEKAKVMTEADYVAVNRAISGQVLSALDPIGARGVFVASSGAVYMADDPAAEASKRLYGRLKIEDETSFSAWAAKRGTTAAVARVFNVSGPYIPAGGAYALAAFIADALAADPIVIRATRPVIRSYVAISELISVVFGVLTDAATAPIVFDTAGLDVLEMSTIAQVVGSVVRLVGGGSSEIQAPPDRSGAPDRYVGDGMVYQGLLEAHGVTRFGFPDQVRETAEFMAWSQDRGRVCADGVLKKGSFI